MTYSVLRGVTPLTSHHRHILPHTHAQAGKEMHPHPHQAYPSAPEQQEVHRAEGLVQQQQRPLSLSPYLSKQPPEKKRSACSTS